MQEMTAAKTSQIRTPDINEQPKIEINKDLLSKSANNNKWGEQAAARHIKIS